MISVFGSLIGQEEISAVASTMQSQWMGFGKKVGEFESAYSIKYGIDHFALVDSGSNAFNGIDLFLLFDFSAFGLPCQFIAIIG